MRWDQPALHGLIAISHTLITSRADINQKPAACHGVHDDNFECGWPGEVRLLPVRLVIPYLARFFQSFWLRLLPHRIKARPISHDKPCPADQRGVQNRHET